jgi:hypothetical protein
MSETRSTEETGFLHSNIPQEAAVIISQEITSNVKKKHSNIVYTYEELVTALEIAEEDFKHGQVGTEEEMWAQLKRMQGK